MHESGTCENQKKNGKLFSCLRCITKQRDWFDDAIVELSLRCKLLSLDIGTR